MHHYTLYTHTPYEHTICTCSTQYTRVYTQPTARTCTRVPYTQYIHTHMLAPFGHFIEESELLVCGVHLPGILFSCFQALHSFRIQNLALECGPGGVQIINWADAGFTLTDVPDDSNEPFSEEHMLYSEILMLSDIELRHHIPTPVSK